MSQVHDCTVIGAGASGLLAAVTLHEAGRDIIVLEARDRIGGRAYSGALSDGTAFEYGAQQVHGPTIATWEFIARFGLATHLLEPRKRSADAVFLDGEWTSGDLVSEEAYRRLKDLLEDYPSHPNADRTSLHDALLSAGFRGAVLQSAEKRFNVLCPIDPMELSAKSAAEAFRFAGTLLPNFALVEGYSKLWDELSRPVADLIHLNKPVTAVDWSHRGVVVHAGAESFEARTAVVTLPLGVLQAEAVEFHPQLPERKMQAVQGLRMAPTIKVAAEFRHTWWEERLGRVSSFRSGESIFSSWEVLTLDRPGPPMLSAMIGRRGADVSGNPERIRSEFLGDLGAMFPEVDLESELVSLNMADWTADPWARGALSVGPVGHFGLRADLAAPTPPLFWAGEATNSAGNAEAVHGALETGRRAAVEVLHALQPLYVTKPDSRLDWWEHSPRMR